MLENKDYCDYDTRVALNELGYDDSTDLRYRYSQILGDFLGGVKAPTLYEAQKWLREEKNIDISVTISPFEYFATIREFVFWQGEYSWENTIYPNGGKTYEEALSEGIKEAVKILKDSRKQSLELENTEYDYGHNVYHEEL